MLLSMTSAHPRLEFAPPPTPGIVRAIGLAIIAHMLLMVALTWGVNWKRDAVIVTAEAELWSAVPQAAAPKLVDVVPPPPQPVVKTEPPPVVAPKLPDADIALERDKQRAIKEKQEAKEKVEKDKIDQAKEAEKLKAEEAKQAKVDKAQELAKKAADDKKKSETQRQENIKRMAGLAGATGGAAATGAAQQSSGPSPGYAGRIRARIKPNIVFTADIAGNPTATVEVRVSPDGTITSRKLLKSSGNAAWDEAVLKAVDKTEVLPRDVDGQVPPSMEISFRPKD
jgi:colicin import membrane protein